ncbi:peptidase [Paenibacillus peoriae]|uniref:peptidase n=1 Tax=Paenibacillus peoriae TaxID=59893 RepID=UPI001CC1FC99|nr:peptidase [Paenibacillus peoriae]
MITKNAKVLLVCFFSMIFMSSTVSADTSSGYYETPTINGYNYSFTSEVWIRYPTTGHTIEAVGFVKANKGVPAGYMGVQARLFDESGTMKTSSSMAYNDNDGNLTNYAYSPRLTSKGVYYAQSKAAFYYGSGYTSFVGYRSPNQTFSSTNSQISDKNSKEVEDLLSKTQYAVNSNGETYGSALSANTIGDEPKLISAEGTNGVKGYIRSEDLTPNVSSIEEAIKQTGKNGDSRTIPLYDVEGKKAIGEFEIVSNYEFKDSAK